jgi:hypothetical protein
VLDHGDHLEPTRERERELRREFDVRASGRRLEVLLDGTSPVEGAPSTAVAGAKVRRELLDPDR